MYSEVYKVYINNRKQIEEKTKRIIEADKVIHTKYVQPKKEFTEEQKRRFERQKKEIERIINNDKCNKHRAIL